MTNKVVMKFGGSSVATPEKILDVAKILVRRKRDLNDVVCVVSAMGDTTDELIEKAKSITHTPDRREMDQLLVTGEMISVSLLAMACQELGEKAISLTGFQAGFETKGRHGFSKIVNVDTSRIQEALSHGYIVIVAGFQGMDQRGDFTTLGRGGSDTSAVAIAAKLGCPCEIYTDVKGIYTVDPRVHPNAKKLDHVSYGEAMEMAYLGAKIIDPRAVEMAEKYHVTLYIALNTANVLGTYIDKEENLEQSVISNVSVSDHIILVNKKLEPNETMSDLFLKLANKDINIDVISQNRVGDEVYISFTSVIDEKDLILEVDPNFEFIENVSKISVIGNAMRNQSGVAARVFELFNANDIKFYQVSTSEISISYIINTAVKDKVLKLLIKEFDL